MLGRISSYLDTQTRRGWHTSIRTGLLLIVAGISSLLLGFSENGGLDNVTCSQSLQLGLSSLDLDLSAEFFVTDFSGTSSLDLSEIDVLVEVGLAGGKSGFGASSLTVSLGLLNGCLGIDLGNFAVLLSLALGFTDSTEPLCFCDINTSLLIC